MKLKSTLKKLASETLEATGTAGKKSAEMLGTAAEMAQRAGTRARNALAGGWEPPLTFAQVLSEEIDAILRLRRRRRLWRDSDGSTWEQHKKLLRHSPKERQEFVDAETGEIEKIRRHEPRSSMSWPAADTPLGEAFRRSRRHELTGLAFSGGGIRSATFNLGVLQALADLRILDRFDYLSTVSGGGYIGSWLTAWLRRKGRGQVERDLRSEHSTEGTSEHSPITFLRAYSNYLTPKRGFLSLDTWMAAATYLRNMLLNLVVLVLALAWALMLPRLVAAAVLTADSTGPFETAALLVGALVLLIVSIGVIAWNLELQVVKAFRILTSPGVILALVVIPLFLAGTLIALWIPSTLETAEPIPLFGWRLVPLIPSTLPAVDAEAAAGGFSWFDPRGIPGGLSSGDLWPWAYAGAIAYLAFWAFAGIVWWGYWILYSLLAGRWKRPDWVKNLRDWGWAILAAVPSGAVGGILLWLLRESMQAGFGEAGFGDRWIDVLILCPPVAVANFILTGVLHTGLMGRVFPEESRQWWSRLGGWLGLLSLLWLAVFGITFYGPPLLKWLWEVSPTFLGSLGAGWAVSTAAGTWAGRSSATARNGSNRWMELIAKIAPYVFIAGLFALLSWGNHLVLLALDDKIDWSDGARPVAVEEKAATAPGPGIRAIELEIRTGEERFTSGELALSPAPDTGGEGKRARFAALVERAQRESAGLLRGGVKETFLLICVLAGVVALVSWRIDINQFSMHLFYRNRLVRAYLGASRRKGRKPNRFTGFDPQDDFELRFLDPNLKEGAVYEGPLPILNTALNLTGGRELAWQERKANSFVFTPLHYGFVPAASHGDADPYAGAGAFRPMYEKGRSEFVTLGTALATSGAAVSPNMGYHSSRPLAFLLTVFNARLGWWIGNPGFCGRNTRLRTAPRFGLLALFSELLGRIHAGGRYVNLSDGGFFDNLGIYELVRRRCRFILACDAEADPDLEFNALGNAIRRCRSDFGVDIRIDVDPIRKEKATGFSRWHCVVGTIYYDRVDKRVPRGTLVYLKASMTGNESTDLMNYAQRNKDFPHQSTADQWFDESQFESYRELGSHAAWESLEQAVTLARQGRDRVIMEELAREMRHLWHPPSHAVEASFSKHGEKLEEVFENIRSTPDLAFLDEQFYPEWESLLTGTPSPKPPAFLPSVDKLREGFYFCNELIQLMENVYLDLRFEQEWNHPDNRGWMNLFKHWSWSGMFRVTWAISACTYGRRFQKFCEHRLGLSDAYDVEAREIPLELGERSYARPEDVEAALAASGDLNFLERDMIRQYVALPKDSSKPGRLANRVDRIFSLQVTVDSPFEGPEATRGVRFGCGFALARDGAVALFRIQDHLRRMGLGRRSLERVIESVTPAGVAPKSPEIGKIPARYAGDFPRAARRSFVQLFWSVLRNR